MLHNFINIAKWNSLPKNYQSIVHSASHVANTIMMARYDAANPAALKRLIAGGAELRAFPPAVMDASFKAANEFYAETSATNADFKKVYDAVVAFRGDQYLWWQVAEFGFDSFMIRSRARS
jgi:TRAP-type mannitol/chloroaromatic compound transport system substrate-binding protein